MYHVYKTIIRPDHRMYSYFDTLSVLANNMYNTTLFTLRQVLTGIKKAPEKREDHEREVLTLLENTVPLMNPAKYRMPTEKSPYLSYNFLVMFFQRSNNPDYTADALPRQVAQNMVHQAVWAMKSFYNGVKAYSKNPDLFKERPSLPNYKPTGGHSTVCFTNQECHFFEDNEVLYLHFPKTQLTLPADFIPEGYSLQQVTVQPHHHIFEVSIILDDGKHMPEQNKEPSRILAIDIGVNNLAACTSNTGLPALLFKGKIPKSLNQWYNKQMAFLQSAQTKGTTNKFQPTERSVALGLKRKHQMEDFMHKTAKRIIEWSVEHGIDTIIVGSNSGWKQSENICNFQKNEKQNFIQIPFDTLKKDLSYLCERHGIRYMEQEESYTSKASFLLQDPIPVYHDGIHNVGARFSGYRCPRRWYRGNKYQCRGLYVPDKHNRKFTVNSDLNGSANIGRKYFPDLFTPYTVNMDEAIVLRHPDDLLCNHFCGSAV